jgi:hypothetical protein
MVHAAASSPERVVCVVGHAGAGKTTAVATGVAGMGRAGIEPATLGLKVPCSTN